MSNYTSLTFHIWQAQTGFDTRKRTDTTQTTHIWHLTSSLSGLTRLPRSSWSCRPSAPEPWCWSPAGSPPSSPACQCCLWCAHTSSCCTFCWCFFDSLLFFIVDISNVCEYGLEISLRPTEGLEPALHTHTDEAGQRGLKEGHLGLQRVHPGHQRLDKLLHKYEGEQGLPLPRGRPLQMHYDIWSEQQWANLLFTSNISSSLKASVTDIVLSINIAIRA